jgi:hypothetical protein
MRAPSPDAGRVSEYLCMLCTQPAHCAEPFCRDRRRIDLIWTLDIASMELASAAHATLGVSGQTILQSVDQWRAYTSSKSEDPSAVSSSPQVRFPGCLRPVKGNQILH